MFECLVDVLTPVPRQEDPRHAREWKKIMQKAHEKVVDSMQPILRGGWLQSPRTGEYVFQIHHIYDH